MDILKKAGFSEGETRVYEAMLRSETPTLQKIHELTGIERRNVYDIINKLISKGMATYTIANKKKVYHATHPNRILAYLNEKEQEIVQSKREIERELPQMIRMYQSNKEEVDFRIYMGREGMKALYEDFLTCSDNYFIGPNFGIKKYLGSFWDKWNKRREEKKVFWHDILQYRTLDAGLPNYHKQEKLKYYEFRILPPEFDSPHFIVIYGDKVGNLMWKEPLFAFTIENKEIAKNYMDYFNFLWKRLSAQKEK